MEDTTPEPNVCVACIASSQDDDLERDLPPLPSLPEFLIANTLDHDLNGLNAVQFTLVLSDETALEPPNLRLSAPRAPPV
ncbi:hypothetical protein [Litorimonas sp. WD9-15]|uniref:hypothetical protein n=1 Tax=Litorimonas sp. WD9-15 TaxID=3418716 RepID=UPI003D07CAD5